MNKNFFLIILLLVLCSCQGVKDALTEKHIYIANILTKKNDKRIKKFNTMLDTIFELENEDETPTENTKIYLRFLKD